MRNPILLLLTFVAALSVAGCQAAFPPNAATVEGLLIEDLYKLVFVIAAVVFLLVEGLVIWSVIRYRRKASDVVLPAQTHGNLALEVVWTVIPLVTVIGLFFASSQVLGVVDARKPDEVSVKVEVVDTSGSGSLGILMKVLKFMERRKTTRSSLCQLMSELKSR